MLGCTTCAAPRIQKLFGFTAWYYTFLKPIALLSLRISISLHKNNLRFESCTYGAEEKKRQQRIVTNKRAISNICSDSVPELPFQPYGVSTPLQIQLLASLLAYAACRAEEENHSPDVAVGSRIKPS